MTVLNKERILKVAVQQINLRGLRRLSLADLARELGVVKSALYHYFPGGKSDLIDSAFDSEEARLLTMLQQAVAAANGTAAKLLTFMKTRHMFIKEIANLYQMKENVLNEIGGYGFARRQEYYKQEQAILENLLREGIAAGEIREIDVEIAACAIEGAMHQITHSYALTPADSDVDIVKLTDMMLNGLAARAAARPKAAKALEL